MLTSATKLTPSGAAPGGKIASAGMAIWMAGSANCQPAAAGAARTLNAFNALSFRSRRTFSVNRGVCFAEESLLLFGLIEEARKSGLGTSEADPDVAGTGGPDSEAMVRVPLVGTSVLRPCGAASSSARTAATAPAPNAGFQLGWLGGALGSLAAPRDASGAVV